MLVLWYGHWQQLFQNLLYMMLACSSGTTYSLVHGAHNKGCGSNSMAFPLQNISRTILPSRCSAVRSCVYCRPGTFPSPGRRLLSNRPTSLRAKPSQLLGTHRQLLAANLVNPVGINVGSLCASPPTMWQALSDPAYGEMVADAALCTSPPDSLVRGWMQAWMLAANCSTGSTG